MLLGNYISFNMSQEGPCEVCHKSTTQKCSACKEVFYCSIDHQKEHWKLHKSICKAYEVRESTGLGKHLIATRDLAPDDLIFVDSPIVFGPKPHKIEEGLFPCVGCCKLITQNDCQLCPECSWPCCSTDCRGLKASNFHGFECQVLKLRSPREPNSFYEYFRFDVLIVLRALSLQKLNKKKWEEMLKLEDHLEEREPGTEVFKTVQEKVTYLMENFLTPLAIYERTKNQLVFPNASQDIIHKIYGILDVNATELTEEIDAQILYPIASLLEHNCVPNTCQIIDKDNYKITFRAALPIKKGEHITSTYTNILWGTQERRQHLKETKYFSCTCNRCKDPTELGTYLSALNCLGTGEEPCGGTQLPVNPIIANPIWLCNKCHLKLPNEDILKFVSHLSEEVDKELAKKPKMAQLEDFLQKLLTFLHPNHYLAYSVKHSLVQLYQGEDGFEISNEFLNEKLQMCQELIDITKKIDAGNARLSLYMGVLLVEQFVGKFTILTRLFNPDEKEISSEPIKDLFSTIEEAKRVLKYEIQSTSGEKLFNVICNHEIKCRKWLTENGVKI